MMMGCTQFCSVMDESRNENSEIAKNTLKNRSIDNIDDGTCIADKVMYMWGR